MQIIEVGVIGAGQMGNGIAQVIAQAGYKVKLCDLNAAALETALFTINKNLDFLVNKEKISQDQKDETLTRIECHQDLSALANSDLVIEAIIENEKIKSDLLKQLDGICKDTCILASNTSSISISKLASATHRPERVIGLHFMNPVPQMKLVEVIPALQTQPDIFNLCFALMEKLEKTPVRVEDIPGFAANRILIPMINEAIFCLYEGVASANEIDTISQLGMSHKMGPLALADLIGLDTCLSIMEVLYDGFKDSKYRPCPLLVKMVNAGQLGRKSGQGFYSYLDKKVQA
ncbi:3-hydroxybutyryl-CoA dehydrogenase [Marinomonas sp. S3726]|uniref:3-hydroxybutyryl-CoA dehydrogenase n=1 Tax=Marinomonas sp. S3726 TaxID=579484 RepID=UPI0005F9B3DF|nr:3-hydroxybutyryl-CoA dehydrogenase [Marinomonas sp. S3726]KJZ14150.1 3-hydroxybutyryl-CoA dehydrogenase [Marinomonas sp. S3726]